MCDKRPTSTRAVRGDRLVLLAAAAAAGWACQGEPTTTITTPAPQIVIVGLADSPTRLEVPAGVTVVVENFDPVEHTVTSSSAPGAYVPGGVSGVSFDTGPVGRYGAFTIRADAPVGTVVPYFCAIHRETTGERGEIVVVEGASSQ